MLLVRGRRGDTPPGGAVLGTVTSINANPPARAWRDRSRRLFTFDDVEPRMGEILKVSQQLLADTIGLAASAGMAIMFSPTADGGALGIHIWKGDQKDRKYVANAADFERTLEAVKDIAEAHLAGVPGASLKVLAKANMRK